MPQENPLFFLCQTIFFQRSGAIYQSNLLLVLQNLFFLLRIEEIIFMGNCDNFFRVTKCAFYEGVDKRKSNYNLKKLASSGFHTQRYSSSFFIG
jgi:hypothetical protein